MKPRQLWFGFIYYQRMVPAGWHPTRAHVAQPLATYSATAGPITNTTFANICSFALQIRVCQQTSMSMHAAAAAAGARVKRRLEPTMICFSEEPALAEAGYRFAMRVTCNVKQSLEFRRSGQRPDVLREKYIGAGNGSTTTFPVGDLSALQSDSACRGAVRCMLAELPQLRSLHLADGEWDSVVPADIVRQIVRVARGDDANDGFTFCFAMKVHLRIIYDNKALLMGINYTKPSL